MFSDSDSDAEFDQPVAKRPKVYRERINYKFDVGEWNRSRFRLSDDDIDSLVERLKPHIEHPTQRNKALSPEQQIRLAVRYLATGAQFSVLSDAHGVHKSTVCRAVKRVVAAINEFVLPDVVKWPTDRADIRSIIDAFHREKGMPSVIGCVDGTHVNIRRPYEHENQFVNRHGNHSLNVMVVCGPNLKFYYQSARWPGSVNDSRVWRNSNLAERLQSGWNLIPGGIILADSGYPNLNHLITPLLHCRTQQEERFNRAHTGTRRLVECAIGVLKQRFQCLQKTIQMSPVDAAKVVQACIALHNIVVKPLETRDEELLEADRNIQAEETTDEEFDNQPVRRKQLINLF